ncbi:MAG: hypothetical protein ACLUEJ_01945 [Clostridium sp.]|jgi:hypothetical protein|uniref:hypothetical protein n=1 Tax=Clostridium sp. AT4 TaxID=1720194 RepID=UPI00082ACCA3|nr:hypothetical protein [Clostridium sp. AT4]MBS5088956.1 hypothetical protein [Clostridiaceae bacterium]
MTEQEALEVARKQIRAENAAYMREWRKRNPEKDRAIRNRYREKLKAKRKEGRFNVKMLRIQQFTSIPSMQ